jgi:hypothetical protein
MTDPSATSSRDGGPVPAPTQLKLCLVRAAARALRLRQIHIAGCARSGTNMAHVAMLAFEGVVISAQETGPDYPSPGQLLQLYWRGEIGRVPTTLVSKRGFRWSNPEQLARLIRRVREEDIGLLYLVRDPRDVLLSTHEATGPESGYVSVERWHASMLAGERLLASVADRPRILVLRYEDLVLDPVAVQRRLGECFDLQLRPGIDSIEDLERTIAVSGCRLPANRVRSMHRVRPFDQRSVGRWRSVPGADNPVRQHPGLAADFSALMAKYGYEDQVSTP